MVSSALVILAFVPAAAALDLSDSKQASAEIAKKCMQGDFAGATAMLESRGKPIGWQHGKYMLMSCFTDEAGQCLLDSSRCAWLQQCISQDGPCEPPKLTSLLELPGGDQALAELNSDSNSSVMVKGTPHYKMSKIIKVTKKLAKDYKEAMSSEPSSLIQQKSDAASTLLGSRRRKDRVMAAYKEQGDEIMQQMMLGEEKPEPSFIGKAKMAAEAAAAEEAERVATLRKNWLMTKKQRQWVYSMATMALYYIAVCGMEDLGPTGAIAKYAPYGEDKKMVYNEAVHGWKFDPAVFTEGGEWTCHR